MDIPQIHPSGVVISNTKNTVTLKWNEITNDQDMGFSPITNYNIYVDSGSGFVDPPIEVSVGQGYTISPLTTGNTYSFKVTAENYFGEKDKSTATPYSIKVSTAPD